MMWMVLGGVVFVILALIAWMFLRSRSRNKGPVSIVMLRSTPRRLTEADVRGAVRRALAVECNIQRIDFSDSTYALAVASDAFPPLVVVDSKRTYVEPADVESIAARAEDPELRRAIKEHTAWVSVDAFGLKSIPKLEARTMIYNKILGKVAAELLDEQCMVIYAPAESRFGRVTADTETMLRDGRVGDLLDDDDLNIPMVHVESSDEQINAAIETARARLPELIGTFQRIGAKSNAIIKAKFCDADNNCEHMWCEVKAVEAGVVIAEVANRPTNPKLPARGQSVRITRDMVSDWACADEKGKVAGPFVEKLLRKHAK